MCCRRSKRRRLHHPSGRSQRPGGETRTTPQRLQPTGNQHRPRKYKKIRFRGGKASGREGETGALSVARHRCASSSKGSPTVLCGKKGTSGPLRFALLLFKLNYLFAPSLTNPLTYRSSCSNIWSPFLSTSYLDYGSNNDKTPLLFNKNDTNVRRLLPSHYGSLSVSRPH